LTVRLGPFFKFYGSKYRIAPLYPAPLYDTLIEPFAGSASYATLHHTRQVGLAEVDPDVAAVWRYLISVDGQEIAKLPVCDGPDALPAGFDLRGLDVPEPARLLIRYWQRVGQSRCWTVSKWGHLSGFWCARTRDRLAAQVEHIRHWRILEGSLVGAMPRGKGTWFIDPPYQAQSTVYGDAPDFALLGRWVRALPGQVIVCEAPSATWLPFVKLTEARVGPSITGKSHAKRTEMIWTNSEGNT
jgi:hypothetical protein